MPGAIASLDIAHIVPTVQGVPQVYQHCIQIIDHGRVVPVKAMVRYVLLALLLLLLVMVLLLVVLMRHVGRQVQLKPKLHPLANLVAPTKEVEALEVHCQYIWCLIYADALVSPHLQTRCR